MQNLTDNKLLQIQQDVIEAIQAGAYGGGREGVLAAEAARGAAQSRAGLQAQLLAQGFQQAQAAAAQDLAARQGLDNSKLN